jgi:hypothetical protein
VSDIIDPAIRGSWNPPIQLTVLSGTHTIFPRPIIRTFYAIKWVSFSKPTGGVFAGRGSSGTKIGLAGAIKAEAKLTLLQYMRMMARIVYLRHLALLGDGQRLSDGWSR